MNSNKKVKIVNSFRDPSTGEFYSVNKTLLVNIVSSFWSRRLFAGDIILKETERNNKIKTEKNNDNTI